MVIPTHFYSLTSRAQNNRVKGIRNAVASVSPDGKYVVTRREARDVIAKIGKYVACRGAPV